MSSPHSHLYIVFNGNQTGSDAGCQTLTRVRFKKGDRQMKTQDKISLKESKMKMTASTLSRLAGLSALVAGICYIVVGIFHPLNVLASVTTAGWTIVHIFAIA